MGKAGIAIKGMISNTMGSIKRVFGLLGRSASIASEKHVNNVAEVEDREYVYKLRLDRIRCVPIGSQQIIVCYDQYTGKVL